ncbi:uncharacterized protein LOC127789910 [Diospyros lotus]|uniref:uncharacterized protein LOC127789910 n=1 Tax=Diospyros lotus TaxID=55363 RepID=UPI00225631FE|nr:uncharacterized protein LOC127789910 [Diospyros lotus]
MTYAAAHSRRRRRGEDDDRSQHSHGDCTEDPRHGRPRCMVRPTGRDAHGRRRQSLSHGEEDPRAASPAPATVPLPWLNRIGQTVEEETISSSERLQIKGWQVTPFIRI